MTWGGLMALLIIGRSVENAGVLQYHSIGSILVEAFRKTCERIEMEISGVKFVREWSSAV